MPLTNSITVDLIYLICSNAHGFTHMTFEIFNIVKFLLFICCGCNFAWIVDCLFFFFVVGCRFVDPILTSIFLTYSSELKHVSVFFYFCRTYWYWSVSCFWYCLWTSHDFYSKVCLTWFNLCSCISFGTSFLENVQVSYIYIYIYNT